MDVLAAETTGRDEDKLQPEGKEKKQNTKEKTSVKK
jgi:hypothetical protein